jgi:hypothetical protein
VGYLAPLSAISGREAIAKGVASVPLFMIKVLRGQSIYLSTKQDRAHVAVDSVVSNYDDPGFAGLGSGAFFTVRPQPRTLLHGLCHLVDQAAINDRPRGILHPWRYPKLVELGPERYETFRVPDSEDAASGFVSEYAKETAYEDFAEHCAAYVLERGAFRTRADAELGQGHDLLDRKFRFMEKLFATSPIAVRLSAAVVDAL